MRLISAVFPRCVAIDKKSLFLGGSIVTIVLSVKGKGNREKEPGEMSHPNPPLNSDFHIKKVEKTWLIRQDTCVQIQTKP